MASAKPFSYPGHGTGEARFQMGEAAQRSGVGAVDIRFHEKEKPIAI